MVQCVVSCVAGEATDRGRGLGIAAEWERNAAFRSWPQTLTARVAVRLPRLIDAVLLVAATYTFDGLLTSVGSGRNMSAECRRYDISVNTRAIDSRHCNLLREPERTFQCARICDRRPWPHHGGVHRPQALVRLHEMAACILSAPRLMLPSAIVE